MNDTDSRSKPPALFDFVDYDPVRPHPMFTALHVAYIRKIEDYLSPEELEVVRKIERFRTDLKTGIVRRDEVSGLRSLPEEMVNYIQRSSDKPYPEMMEKTIDTINRVRQCRRRPRRPILGLADRQAPRPVT